MNFKLNQTIKKSLTTKEPKFTNTFDSFTKDISIDDRQGLEFDASKVHTDFNKNIQAELILGYGNVSNAEIKDDFDRHGIGQGLINIDKEFRFGVEAPHGEEMIKRVESAQVGSNKSPANAAMKAVNALMKAYDAYTYGGMVGELGESATGGRGDMAGVACDMTGMLAGALAGFFSGGLGGFIVGNALSEGCHKARGEEGTLTSLIGGMFGSSTPSEDQTETPPAPGENEDSEGHGGIEEPDNNEGPDDNNEPDNEEQSDNNQEPDDDPDDSDNGQENSEPDDDKDNSGSDDGQNNDGQDGNPTEETNNPMDEGQGGNDDESSSSVDVDSNINWGPDGQSGGGDDSSYGGPIDELDPITNWGPDGKDGEAQFGTSIGIGIGVLDPHTNWNNEQSDMYVISDFSEVLGNINPTHNGSDDDQTNFVDSMAAAGDDLF